MKIVCDKIRKTDAPLRLSDGLGREKEQRKEKKIQRKRKNKQPDKQLPLALITPASIDHPGSCSEGLLLQHHTLRGSLEPARSSVVPYQAGASPVQRGALGSVCGGDAKC